MDYETLPMPEPEPMTTDVCEFIVLEPFNYIVMAFGAGIGYFILGGYFGIYCCEKRDNDREVILANPIMT